jgi:hypothetical protein
MMVASRRSLRSLRWASAVGRWLLCGLAVTGVAASARFLVAPPRASVRVAPAPREDRAVAATAVAFARAYLAFDGGRPDAARSGLARVAGEAASVALAPNAPPLARQRVRSADVVQIRTAPDRAQVVTVAADTSRAGVLYLAVRVRRRPDGALQISGAPAFVGGPLAAPADPDPDARRREVSDRALTEVCRRALENYLAGAGRNLAADLSPAARVTLPALPLTVERMGDLRWSSAGRSVVAGVEVRDRDGVRYAQRYELDVARTADRWQIAAIGIDPSA